MTALLQRAVAEVEKLSQEDQDAIASRLLAEIEDERRWAASFESTTDAQWDRMIKEAKADVAAGKVHALDVAFPLEKS